MSQIKLLIGLTAIIIAMGMQAACSRPTPIAAPVAAPADTPAAERHSDSDTATPASDAASVPDATDFSIDASEDSVIEKPGGPQIFLPAGSTVDGATLRIEAVSAPVESREDDLQGLGSVYEVSLTAGSLLGPAEIALPIDVTPSDLQATDIFVAYLDGEEGWVALPSRLSDDRRYVLAEVDHFTRFGAFGGILNQRPRISALEALPPQIQDVGWPPCFEEDLGVRVDANDPDGTVELVEVQFTFYTSSTQALTKLTQFVSAINGLGLVLFAGNVSAGLPAAQTVVRSLAMQDPGLAVTEWLDVTGGASPDKPGSYYGFLALSRFRTCEDYFDVSATMDAIGIERIGIRARVTDSDGKTNEASTVVPIFAGEQPYADLRGPGSATGGSSGPRPVFRWQLKGDLFGAYWQRLVYQKEGFPWSWPTKIPLDEFALSWSSADELPAGEYRWWVDVSTDEGFVDGKTIKSAVFRLQVTDKTWATLAAEGTVVQCTEIINDVPERALKWRILSGGQTILVDWARLDAAGARLGPLELGLRGLSLPAGTYQVVLEMDGLGVLADADFRLISDPVEVVVPDKPTSTPTPTATDTPTRMPTRTPTPTQCVGTLHFIRDISIPDDAIMAAGANFQKIWRVGADGRCGYPGGRLRFGSGERFGWSDEIVVPRLDSGDEYDIELSLTAPGKAGTYTGAWELEQPGAGVLQLYTRIRVGTELPDVRGLSLPEASARLKDLGFGYTWDDACDPQYGIGLISAQKPAAHTMVDPSLTIVVLTRNLCEAAEINLWVDNEWVAYGTCTVVHWDVRHVKEVYFMGEPVVGQDQKQVCPTEHITDYTLLVKTNDGAEVTRTVRVQIIIAVPPPTAGAAHEMRWETTGGGQITFAVTRDGSNWDVFVSSYQFQPREHRFTITAESGTIHQTLSIVMQDQSGITSRNVGGLVTGSWTTLQFSDGEHSTTYNDVLLGSDLRAIYDYVVTQIGGS